MQNPLSDPDTAAYLASVSTALDQAEEAATTARAAVNAAAQRASDLRTRTAAHRAAEPATSTASISAALASDPGSIGTAAHDAEIRTAADAGASDHGKWRLELEALEGAAPIIAAEQEQLAEALDHAKAAHEAAWGNFCRAGRAALALEAEKRLGAVYAEVLGAYEAMIDVRRLDNAGPVAGDNAPRLGFNDNGITVWWPEPNGLNPTARGWRPIYPQRPDHETRAAYLAAFRASLAQQPKARSRR